MECRGLLLLEEKFVNVFENSLDWNFVYRVDSVRRCNWIFSGSVYCRVNVFEKCFESDMAGKLFKRSDKWMCARARLRSMNIHHVSMRITWWRNNVSFFKSTSRQRWDEERCVRNILLDSIRATRMSVNT